MLVMRAGNPAAEAPLARLEESDLVERARALDADAWDALYALHYPALHRYAYLRLRDHAAADDIAAETFLEAVRGIGRYQHRGLPFRAWLFRIAHNVTADARARVTRRPAGSIDEASESAGAQPDFAEELERSVDLLNAIEALTPEQQQVIQLRYFAGLSLAETAAATRRNVGAVKSIQHRALQRLRSLMGDVP